MPVFNIFLFPSFFPINSLNEKDHKEVPSTSTDNGISSNIKRPTRSSKICKKCGRSVKNLSRHQAEVYGMSKMWRKLDGYLTGEKKAPNRRVKFCPLLPCKRSKTPIFQLDKHLQSCIHNLKPKTSAYVKALAQAPRASLSNVNSYLNRTRKQRAQTNKQVESDERNCRGNTNEEYDACNEADNSNRQNVKCNPEDIDMNSDQDYEELGRRAQRKIRKKERVAREKKRSKEDSDKEYDRLARKVWEKNEDEKTRAAAKKRNTGDSNGDYLPDSDKEFSKLVRNTSDSNGDYLLDSDKEYSKLVSESLNEECKGGIVESNDREISDNDTEGQCEEEIYKDNVEESAKNLTQNEDFERVEVSESEESQILDPDYLCDEEPVSDTSTQPDTSIVSSSLTK